MVTMITPHAQKWCRCGSSTNGQSPIGFFGWQIAVTFQIGRLHSKHVTDVASGWSVIDGLEGTRGVAIVVPA